ncbi:MAG: hypothetical protein JWO64_1295 [Hyphomicrobiales bacterium]|jgi:hypothetical protein|nr:hypothetical protein [Hyphomicrobiales bacterium]
MRMFMLCACVLYGGAAVDDTKYIKPSQLQSLEELLDASLPDWIGTATRVSLGD